MSALLLDTCAAIFAGEGQLSSAAEARIRTAEEAGEVIYLSPITGWELGLLFSRGRLRSSLSPGDYLRRLTGLPGVALADMSPEILLQSSFLPGDFHADPADRILAATARAFGYTVMTRDRALLAYAQEGHLRAMAC